MFFQSKNTMEFNPVNFVAKFIWEISRRGEFLGKSFHVTNPKSPTYSLVCTWIGTTISQTLQQVSYEEFRKKLENSTKNPLHAVLSFFPVRS